MPCHFAHLSLLLTTNNLSESWLSSNTFIQRLTSFHRRCARYAAGQHIRQNDPNNPEEEWTYPPTDTVLEAAGLVYDQFRKTSEADATVYVYLFRFRTIDVYRQCLHPFL
jgi:hypothetical protein